MNFDKSYNYTLPSNVPQGGFFKMPVPECPNNSKWDVAEFYITTAGTENPNPFPIGRIEEKLLPHMEVLDELATITVGPDLNFNAGQIVRLALKATISTGGEEQTITIQGYNMTIVQS